MCGLFTKSTALEWLESQAHILDCWITDSSINPDSDADLLDCLQMHQKWLRSEIQILQNPGKYRLSNFSKHPVYPLLESENGQ